MKTKKLSVLSIVALTIFLNGCKEEIVVDADEGLNAGPAEAIGSEEGIPTEEQWVLDKLLEKFPKATLYHYIMLDIDHDQILEIIPFFSTLENNVNIALLKEGSSKGIAIGQGLDYVEDSLRYEEGTNFFFIALHDEEKNQTIDYKITIENDDQISSTNFIVETINEREE